jgi:gliding motility-associated-like protein
VVTSATAGLTFSLNGSAFVPYPAAGYSGLNTGDHILIAKNIDGCTSQVTVTIGSAPGAPLTPTVQITHPTCLASTGSFTITSATGGFTYSLDGTNFAAYPPGGYAGLQPGPHTLQVKNVDGCTNSVTVTINAVPPTPAAPTVLVTDPTCGLATGSFVVTSPTTGLTFSLDGGPFAAYPASGYSGLNPGSYQLEVMNSEGCTNETTVVIGSAPGAPALPTYTVTEPTCAEATGSFVVTSATAGLTFSINGGPFAAYPVGGYTGLNSGNHPLVVKTTEGCTSSLTITIGTAPQAPPLPVVSASHPNCNVSIGILAVAAPTGSGYTYSINGTDFQSSPVFTGVAPGNYTVTVRSSDGCLSSSNATINNSPDTPAIPVLTVTDLTCTNNTGTITVSSPIGNGNTYSISGTNFQSSPVFSGLAPGPYTVTVRNNAGCESTAATRINLAPGAPVVTAAITNVLCEDDHTGAIRLTLTGGVGPFSYRWSNGPATRDIGNLAPGAYSVTVIYDNACEMKFDYNITVLDTIPPVAICKDIEVFLGPSGRILLSPTMVDGGSYDKECGIERMIINPTELTCDDVGVNIVTLYVYDPSGNLDSCKATVTVIGNYPPVAQDDNVRALVDQPTLILPLINDSDPNGALVPGSLQIITPPVHGTATINPATGSIIYTPGPGYTGTDRIVYTICDDGNYCGVLCDTAVINITVVPENVPPVAVDDYFTTGCFPATGNILSNDFDPDNDNIILNTRLVKEPRYGEMTLNQNGSFVYIPYEGFSGTDTMRYFICDNGFPSKCDTAYIYIEVFKDLDCDGIPDIEPVSLFVPEGFSPNGDGIHDFFQVEGIEDYPEAVMMIFNRWGNKIFEKERYGNLGYWGSNEEAWWWGYSDSGLTFYSDQKVPIGNYLYILNLRNGTVRTGTVMVSY